VSILRGLLEFIGGVVIVIGFLSFLMAYLHTRRQRDYLPDPQADERDSQSRFHRGMKP
jgi:hypothetical protein